MLRSNGLLHRGRLTLACVPAGRFAIGPFHLLAAPCSRFGTAEPTKMILEAADKLPPALSPIPANLKSRFVGISWSRSNKKWEAQITVARKKIYLGLYPCEEEAARAYDEQAGALGRPVNFPKKGQAQAEKQGAHGIISKFVGVYWHASSSKWNAYIKLEDGSRKSLGYFDAEAEAARAYDRYARTLGKPLNFPSEGELQAQKQGTSNFQGTHWNGKEWEAVFIGLGERTHLGVFASEVEAARAHDVHLVDVTGSARVNFPGEGAGKLRQANVKSTSKFVGVGRERTLKGWWFAQITIDGKKVSIGTFETEEEAAREYDERAGPLGRPTNFPKKGQTQANKRGSSMFKGVSWDSRQNKWRARNMVNGKTVRSLHESEEDAARAYDERAGALGRAVNFVK